MSQVENHSSNPETERASDGSSCGFVRACSGRSRVKPDGIPYQVILNEFLADPFSVNDKYDFEHVKTYFLKPDDDLEEAIKTHVKVALEPESEYVIRKPVKIKSLCYIIGNGAKIKVACTESFGIEIYNRDHIPGIVGMWAVTFQNVIFERDRSLPGGIVHARTFVLFHGCNFLGCMGSALSLSSGGDIRGCHFYACYKCIDSNSKLKVSVSYCVFEACMVGIISVGLVTIRNCTGHNIYCFAFMMGSGKVISNSILNSNKFYESGLIEMISCHGGTVLPLATLHICSSFSHTYPTLRGNVFTRCKVYVGDRVGIFAPVATSLSYSSIIANKEAFQSLNLQYTFHQSSAVWKLLRSLEPDSAEVKKCLCGEVHYWPVLEQLDYTLRALPNPYDSSCDSKLYDSDDD